LLVFQHLVGMFHPLFAQVAYLFRDETFTEMKLLSARLNHESCSRAGEDVRECFSCCHCLRKRSRFNLAREQPISPRPLDRSGLTAHFCAGKQTSEGRNFGKVTLSKHVSGGPPLVSQRSDVVAAAAYVGTLRAAIIAGNFDLE
jgi:hypothetical protein